MTAWKGTRLFLQIHRRGFLRVARYWQTCWGERSLIIALAICIGGVVAVTAALLHTLVMKLELFGVQLTQAPKQLHEHAWLVVLFILPLVGMLGSFMIQRCLGGPRYAKSLSPLILALNRKRSNIPAVEMISHMLSSAVSVGFGGSAGLEAPSVLTGAAIGANSAGFLHIDRRHRPLLLGCGAAASISAIFNSPIAGVLFAAEVLLPDFSVSALVPMMMSSAVAAVVSRQIMGESQFILAINAPWHSNAIPCYFICGFFCALVGVYVIKSAYFIADWLRRTFRNAWGRLLVGGSALCVLLIIFPMMRGQGYLYIEKLFAGDMEGITTSAPLLSWIPSTTGILITLLVAALLLKVVVSVLTVDAGGDGGIFAPSMFIGAFAGFTFARVVNLTGLISLQEHNFVAVGMCGVFTAVMRAPLTGIFLIAEVTGSYILLVPLMIVSSVAWISARFFEPHSIYRKALAESQLLSDDRDLAMLSRLPVRLNVSRNYHVLRLRDPLKKVIELVELTPEEIFPVQDDNGKLLGVVHLEKILAVMLNPKVYELLVVFDLMDPPLGMVSPDDDLGWAMANFEKYNLKYLPVCDANGIFHGFIAKATIFAKYRRMVSEVDSF